MKTFSGFASGSGKQVSFADQFFTDLLPLIDDLVELKVTLTCLRLFDQKSGLARWATLQELQDDPSLKDILTSIDVGLENAVQRGSIVKAIDRFHVEYLFANDDHGRAAKQAIERGESMAQIPAIASRPNIYVLYEQNIGTLTPMIAEELKDAEKEFLPEWIIEAFQEAARRNARSWAYIKKILEGRATKRATKGKKDEGLKRDVGIKWQEDLKKYRDE